MDREEAKKALRKCFGPHPSTAFEDRLRGARWPAFAELVAGAVAMAPGKCGVKD
jgi:hypothetical protein